MLYIVAGMFFKMEVKYGNVIVLLHENALLKRKKKHVR